MRLTHRAFVEPSTGLIFPSNDQAGSDIRIVHAGISRINASVIWRKRYVQQDGYEGTLWWSPNGGPGSWDGGDYSVGFTGHPCDGTVDSDGNRSVGTGSSGTVQYEEIAGCGGANDYIASPSSPGPQSTFNLSAKAGQWLRQCAVIAPNGSNTEHIYYPDLESRPTEFIKQAIATSSIGSGGSNPRMYFGASDWTASGDTNEEATSATLRGTVIFQPALTNPTHIQAVSALETDAQVLAWCAANGITSLYYLNMNPTPSDVSDKSGGGHHPSWANANRPTLYTG